MNDMLKRQILTQLEDIEFQQKLIDQQKSSLLAQLNSLQKA